MKVQEKEFEVVESGGEGSTPPKKKPGIAKIVVPLVLVLAVVFGYRHISWSRTHESTDNAQIAGDVVQIVPQVSGTISKIAVADNQVVKKGDLLVVLDDSKYAAAVAQAKANLDSAIADARAAGIAVELTRASSAASEVQASGGVDRASAGVGQAQTAIDSATAELQANRTAEQTAKYEISNARAQVQSADDGLKQARAMLVAAQTQLSSAKASVRSSESGMRSAQAKADLAAKDRERAEKLFEQGAISRQQLDASAVAETGAKAALDAAREQWNAAKSLVNQRQAELTAAEAKVHSASTSVNQAKLGVGIAQERLKSTQASGTVTRSQIESARHSLAAAQGAKVQALGQSQETATSGIQVKLKQAAEQQALAKVGQAKAALAAAELDLQRTRVFAPADGRISKRTAEVGNLAQAGAALFSLVRSDSIFVNANFKETQVAKLRPGEEVNVEIDAFPGREFHGVIDSQAAATGSTFALLPPDNATGNFVKVVQRLPVKIRFDDPPEKLRDLQVGMSAMVTVKVG